MGIRTHLALHNCRGSREPRGGCRCCPVFNALLYAPSCSHCRLFIAASHIGLSVGVGLSDLVLARWSTTLLKEKFGPAPARASGHEHVRGFVGCAAAHSFGRSGPASSAPVQPARTGHRLGRRSIAHRPSGGEFRGLGGDPVVYNILSCRSILYVDTTTSTGSQPYRFVRTFPPARWRRRLLRC